MAVCIAVIAKENYPLYIRSTPTENELKFHYMVHTSLDVVDEKISAMGKALVDQRELYLGLLYPTKDYKVMFRKLHNSYTVVMCNPFYNSGDRIQSSRAFDNMVTSMMIQVC
uniref:Trafficking protein particle complex subunit 2-like protein n=1 Tax=Macaca nemestrina TaxID=9545 RepID=A0A2K6ATI2_MACNE